MQQGVNYKGLLFENGISFNNWECVTHSVGTESELYDLYFGLKFSFILEGHAWWGLNYAMFFLLITTHNITPFLNSYINLINIFMIGDFNLTLSSFFF